jgi:hypothetical protein
VSVVVDGQFVVDAIDFILIEGEVVAGSPFDSALDGVAVLEGAETVVFGRS